MSEQLVLSLAHDPAWSDTDFFVAGCNEAAHRLVMSWPDWPSPVCVIYGPPGSGKTHLAHIWAARAEAARLPAKALMAQHVGERRAPVAVEDADVGPFDETALFHLLNMAREQGFSVLLTGREAPGHWTLTLPDLRSRVRSYPAVAIAEPDDELLAAIAIKLFADRQLTLSPDALTYLIKRAERSPQAIAAIVCDIDAASLATGRRLTKTFIAGILKDRVPENDGEAVP